MSGTADLADRVRALEARAEDLGRLSLHLDLHRFEELRRLDAALRRRALLHTVGASAGLALVTGVLISWWLAAPAALAGALGGFVITDRRSRAEVEAAFDAHKRALIDAVPRSAGLSRDLVDGLGRLPKDALAQPGASAPPWRQRAWSATHRALVAWSALTDGLSGRDPVEGEVLRTAEKTLVHLMEQCGRLHRLAAAAAPHAPPGAAARLDGLETLARALEQSADVAQRDAHRQPHLVAADLRREADRLHDALAAWAELDDDAVG